MKKILLNKIQLTDLIIKNRYPVNPKNKFISRCIDGRYESQVKNDMLPALAFPGADAGELALIFATANEYGFEVDRESAFKSLVEVVGGEKNLSFHSDSHAEKDKVLVGCGHIKQISLTLSDYKLHQEQLDFIKKKFTTAQKNGAKQNILYGEHLEGAVVFILGNYGIYPQYHLEEHDDSVVQIFIYHQTLVDERHRVLVGTLLKNKAIKLFPGCDEDYLYQAISEMAENHLIETAKRLASRLPIFQVIFEEDGSFKINEMGKV